jgi:hypothetical protein
MPTNAEILNLVLTDTPLDDPAKMANAAELFHTVGLAASEWTRLEVHLDFILIYLNQPKHSEEIYDKDHPMAFKKKVRLLKRWFNQHPILKPFAADFRALSPRLIELSNVRNTFLHSILSSYDPNTKEAVWRGIRPLTATTYSVSMHVGTIARLINFAGEVHSAHVAMAKIDRKMVDSGAIEQLRISAPHTRRLVRLYRRLRACLGF